MDILQASMWDVVHRSPPTNPKAKWDAVTPWLLPPDEY